MVLPLIGLIVIVAGVSAIVGSLIVYIDAQQRNADRQMFWTGITGLGFIFGLLPGLALISTYFVVSRKF